MRVTGKRSHTYFPTTSHLGLGYRPSSFRNSSSCNDSQTESSTHIFVCFFFSIYVHLSDDNTMSMTKKSKRNHHKRDMHSLSELRKQENPSVSHKETQMSFFPELQLIYWDGKFQCLWSAINNKFLEEKGKQKFHQDQRRQKDFILFNDQLWNNCTLKEYLPSNF